MVQASFSSKWPLSGSSNGIADPDLSNTSCKATGPSTNQGIDFPVFICFAFKESIHVWSSVTPATLDARDKARPDLAACSRAAAAEQQELDGLLMSASSTLTSLTDEARQFGEALSLVDQRMAHCQDQLLAGVTLRLEAQVTFMISKRIVASVGCMFGMPKQRKADACWHKKICASCKLRMLC